MTLQSHAVFAENIVKRFGENEVLSGVNLKVPRHSRLGIIGPAACGKSVLLKIISGLEHPTAGAISVFGDDISKASEDELMPLRLRIGMLFQNYALFDFLTVRGNVEFPLRRLGTMTESEISSRAAERLRQVGLAGSENQYTDELSGGMKKRVGIARATVARPELAIYDEPTAGLDPVTTQKIYDLILADQEATGCTVIAVSSDVDGLRQFADQIAMLHEGRIRYAGPADAIADAEDPVVRQFVRGAVEGPL